jgi:hypothetical protein
MICKKCGKDLSQQVRIFGAHDTKVVHSAYHNGVWRDKIADVVEAAKVVVRSSTKVTREDLTAALAALEKDTSEPLRYEEDSNDR